MNEVINYYKYLTSAFIYNKMVSDDTKNYYIESNDGTNNNYKEQLNNLIKEKEIALENTDMNKLDTVIERLADYLVKVILIDDNNKIAYYKSSIKLVIFDYLISNNLSIDKKYAFVGNDYFSQVREYYSRYSKIKRDKSIISEIDLLDDSKLFITSREYLSDLDILLSKLYRKLNSAFFRKREDLKINSIEYYSYIDHLYNSIEELTHLVVSSTHIKNTEFLSLKRNKNIKLINKTIKSINKAIKNFDFDMFQELYVNKMEEKVEEGTNRAFYTAIYKNIPEYLKMNSNEVKIIFEKFFKIYNFSKDAGILRNSNILVSKDLNAILTIYEIIKNCHMDIDYSKIDINGFRALTMDLDKILETIEHSNYKARRSNGIITSYNSSYVPKRKK